MTWMIPKVNLGGLSFVIYMFLVDGYKFKEFVLSDDPVYAQISFV